MTQTFRDKKRDSNKKDEEGVEDGGEKHRGKHRVRQVKKKNIKNKVIKFIEYY